MPKAARKQSPAHRHAPALAALVACDRKLALVIERIGPYALTPAPGGFAAIVRSIVNQQVSKYAGDAILGRLHALFEAGVPEPAAMLRIKPRKLQSVGLSRRKVEYLR